VSGNTVLSNGGIGFDGFGIQPDARATIPPAYGGSGDAFAS
jgi:hypothetical protein